MRKFANFLTIFAVLLACGPFSGTAADAPFALRQAGIIEEMSGQAAVTSASGQSRPAAVQSAVFVGDLVKTGDASRVQLRLKDQTVFVISSNSEIRMDEFVFEPKYGAGLLKVYVKGIFRFVTGKIVKQKPENMKVKMPVGFIAIRGTRVAGRADERGSLVMLEAPGKGEEAGRWLSVGNEVNGQIMETVVNQFGYGTQVFENQAPQAAVQIAMDVLNSLVEDLGGLDEAINENIDESMFDGGDEGGDDAGDSTGESGEDAADYTDDDSQNEEDATTDDTADDSQNQEDAPTDYTDDDSSYSSDDSGDSSDDSGDYGDWGGGDDSGGGDYGGGGE